MKQTVSEVAQREWKSYEESQVEITEGYHFNQYQTIRRITHYLNDRFFEAPNDMIFWNLSTPRIPHFAKHLDLDTKDLMPIGKGDTNFYQTWILKVKFRKWLRETNFALTLNDLAEGLAQFGSVVFKKVETDNNNDNKYELQEVKLDNLAFDAKAKDIRQSDYIIERHYLTEFDIRAKEGAWDNIAEAIEKGERVETDDENDSTIPTYVFYERFGQVEDENEEYIYTHSIFTGTGDKEVVVFEDRDLEPEDNPYYDFHIGKYNGRWMRQGVVERLFKLQERVNALVNQNAMTTEISSLLLLRTADPETRGNVLQSLESGEIINSADLQQVPIDNRALNGFLSELQTIETQADRLALTPDIIRGDTPPSSTPFRSLAVINNAAKNVFNFYKQSVGEKLGEILRTEIMPEVIRKWNHGDLLEIADSEEDIILYDNLLLNKKLWTSATEYARKSGRLPSATQLQQLASRLLEEFGKDKRKMEIPKGFFNFKYGIEMNVTDENQDKAAMNETIVNALNMYLANPTILQNPLFRQMLENNGITPPKFENKMQEPQQQQGGQQIQPKQQDKLLTQANIN